MNTFFDNLINFYAYLKYIFCKYCYTTNLNEMREPLML